MQRILTILFLVVLFAFGAFVLADGLEPRETPYKPPSDPALAAVLVGALAAVAVLTLVTGAGLAFIVNFLTKEMSKGESGEDRPRLEKQFWIVVDRIAQSPLVRAPARLLDRVFPAGEEKPIQPYTPPYSYQAVPEKIETRQWIIGAVIALAALIGIMAYNGTFGEVGAKLRQLAEMPAAPTPVPTQAEAPAVSAAAVDVSAEFAALPKGDAAAGEKAFADDPSLLCKSCHSLTPDQVIVGPSLAGVGTRAATRKERYSTELYIYESIVHPSAYVVSGFNDGVMPKNFKESLTPQQIADLVAYLATLK